MQAFHEAESARHALELSEQNRRLAEQVNSFFSNELMDLATPIGSGSATTSLLDALQIAASRIDERFPDDPRLQVIIRERFGGLFWGMDKPIEAIEQYNRAIEIHEQIDGILAPETLKAKSQLAQILRNAHQFVEAKKLFEATLAEQEKVLGNAHVETITTALQYGVLLRWINDENSLSHSERVYKRAATSLGPRHPRTLEAQSDYAWTLRSKGQNGEAIALIEPVVQAFPDAFGDEHFATMFARFNFAECLKAVGRLNEAAAELESLLRLRKRVLGAANVDTLWTASLYSKVLCDLDRTEEAKAVLMEALDQLEKVESDGSAHRAAVLDDLTSILLSMHQAEQAVRVANVAFNLRSRSWGSGDPRTIQSQLLLVNSLFHAGTNDKAQSVAAIAMEHVRKSQHASEFVHELELLQHTLKDLVTNDRESNHDSLLQEVEAEILQIRQEKQLTDQP